MSMPGFPPRLTSYEPAATLWTPGSRGRRRGFSEPCFAIRMMNGRGERHAMPTDPEQGTAQGPSGTLACRRRRGGGWGASGVEEEARRCGGEVSESRPEERDWEGALERLLHNFGVSMLVADAHYARVAEWVDRTHLGERPVYYRVRDRRATDHPTLHPASLVRKIVLKPDCGFYGWLEAEFARRFDYACCDTLDQFRREQQAITRAGQIKAGNERHEKDDRHRIGDPSRFVLGWSNDDKITALENQPPDLKTTIHAAPAPIAHLHT